MTDVHAQADDDIADAALASRPAGGLLLTVLAVAALTAVLTTLLPHDAYIRYQQLRETIQFRSQWVYERIELDPTPIHVAVIGNSRVGAGVSAPQLQSLLQARTGKSVQVANLSLPQEGRNIHFVVAKRLLESRPEVRTIVMSVIEEMPRTGHPAFRDLADAVDVAGAPMLLNANYANDLAVLPYRQMSLFVQSLSPGLFGVSTTLAPGYAGPGYDTTLTFRTPTGNVVNRDSVVPEAELEMAARRVIGSGTPRILPKSLAPYEFAIERTYTREIADLARRRGVRVIFLKLPIYSDRRVVGEPAFYSALGPILSPAFLATDSTYYSDYGHLNRRGSSRATAWLAERLVDVGAAGMPEDSDR